MTTKPDDTKEREAFAKRFAAYVLKRRTEIGLTPAEFGRQVGLERSHVARFDAGENVPSLFLVQKIAAVFGENLSEFLADFE